MIGDLIFILTRKKNFLINSFRHPACHAEFSTLLLAVTINDRQLFLVVWLVVHPHHQIGGRGDGFAILFDAEQETISSETVVYSPVQVAQCGRRPQRNLLLLAIWHED